LFIHAVALQSRQKLLYGRTVISYGIDPFEQTLLITIRDPQSTMSKPVNNTSLNTMEHSYRDIISAIGEDLSRPGLVDTPLRAAKAMQFLTRGYEQDVDKVINNALFPSSSEEMVIVKNIELYSMCEHHMLPFIGKCHVAYLPNGKVLGLSKIARIVDMYARRLQIQENLTKEIAEVIIQKTDAAGAAVIIEAQHMCMMMRGVEKQNSVMTTSCMLGAFRNSQNTRNEFLSLIRR
jgi:GTP cyclohydrolase I